MISTIGRKAIIGDILTLDPAGGESTSGLFYYHSWSKWELGEYKPEEGENWLKQVENIENWTKKGNVKYIAIETGKLHLILYIFYTLFL